MKSIAIVLAGIMAVIMFFFLQKLDTGNWIRSIKDEVNGYDYGRLARRLHQSSWSEKITPPVYRAYQSVLGVLGFALALSYDQHVVICILVGSVFMMVPGMLLKAKIKKENEKMLQDIEHLYNLLHLQRAAGSFFLDSLIDVYRVVSYWRLKKALIDLAGAINTKKNVREATNEFAAKFDNPYISSLADIIWHCVESGDTSLMLADVSEQIAGIQQARYIKEQGKQEMLNILYLTLLFIGAVAAIVYTQVIALGANSFSLF